MLIILRRVWADCRVVIRESPTTTRNDVRKSCQTLVTMSRLAHDSHPIRFDSLPASASPSINNLSLSFFISADA